MVAQQYDMSGCPATYGDERIEEFWRLAQDWDNATPQAHHPNNHKRHAEMYRKKAQQFSDFHKLHGR